VKPKGKAELKPAPNSSKEQKKAELRAKLE